MSAAYRDVLGVVEGDSGVWTMPFAPALLGRPGFLHGGAITGFLTLACDALAVRERPGFAVATTEMRFVRGGRERTSHARAAIRSAGVRLIVVEAAAWQDDEATPIAVMTRKYVIAS